MAAKRSPANDYMADAHSMDYSVLELGHGPVSKKTLHLVDLDVHVHGLEEIKGSSLPVAVVVSLSDNIHHCVSQSRL